MLAFLVHSPSHRSPPRRHPCLRARHRPDLVEVSLHVFPPNLFSFIRLHASPHNRHSSTPLQINPLRTLFISTKGYPLFHSGAHTPNAQPAKPRLGSTLPSAAAPCSKSQKVFCSSSALCFPA